jgi:hypothetical protein
MGDQLVPGDGSFDLDMVAASLRADSADTDSFFEVLGMKLADALGERVTLEREGGLFRKEKKVNRIVVVLGDLAFEASRGKGSIQCDMRKRVRGIVLSSESLDLDTWLLRLATKLAQEADQSASARAALANLLT